MTRTVDRWCRTHLGAGVGAVLFYEGHLSRVIGLELTSGKRVVVKVRPNADRLAGCAVVHRRLFDSGFPCPEPLVVLEPMGELVASAETMLDQGELLPTTGRSPTPFALALARLVELAPSPGEVASLDPPPPWTFPDFARSELWPVPDDRDVDLNGAGGPAWIDEAGWTARNRLAARSGRPVIGHGDWYTGNLRWIDDRLYAVWDWDSAIVASEAAIAGLAAAVYPTGTGGDEATVAESEAFLDAYQQVRGPFGRDELAEAWAAGLWNRSFDAKKQSATEGGPLSLTEADAIERRRRAES